MGMIHLLGGVKPDNERFLYVTEKGSKLTGLLKIQWYCG